MILILPTIIVLSQISDALAYRLVQGRGMELNPWIGAIGSPDSVLIVKTLLGLVVGFGSVVLMRRNRPNLVAALALVGYVGCLSELVVLL